MVHRRKDREQAVAAVSVAGSFAKAERTGLLAFPLKDPVSAAAGVQADADTDLEVCRIPMSVQYYGIQLCYRKDCSVPTQYI